MSSGPKWVLEVCGAEMAAVSPRHGALRDVELRIAPGEAAFVWLECSRLRLPLCDLAEGLVPPIRGNVRFLGSDWQRMSAREQAACRGRIGRTFDGHAWVSNLTVFENIVLPSLHHTTRSENAIHAEAAALAERIGVAPIPVERPDRVPGHTLQKLQWVRALMGQPLLILLDCPDATIAREGGGACLKEARSALERGAAILWTSGGTDAWDGLDWPRVTRWRVRENRLEALRESA